MTIVYDFPLISLTQPSAPGFNEGLDGKVYRLRRAIYELRQAPNVWNKELNKTLHSLGFQQSYGLSFL